MLLQSIAYDVNKLSIHDTRTPGPEHNIQVDIVFHVLLQAASASSSVFSPSVFSNSTNAACGRRIRELCRVIRTDGSVAANYSSAEQHCSSAGLPRSAAATWLRAGVRQQGTGDRAQPSEAYGTRYTRPTVWSSTWRCLVP